MINHARTLLLNRKAGVNPQDPGEEFVPPEFQQRKLSRPLALAWQALFGTNPDRLYLNYRLRQLLSLIHSTELTEAVYELDPRVTYLPFRQTTFDNVFVPSVSSHSGDGRLYFAGAHNADDGAGISRLVWALKVIDGGTVSVQSVTPLRSSGTQSYTIQNSISSPITLPGSQLTVRFQGSPDDSWDIQSAARPSSDLGTLLTGLVSAVGEGAIGAFFTLPGSNMATCRNLWDSHDIFAYRFGALLMAIIYNIDQTTQVDHA